MSTAVGLPAVGASYIWAHGHPPARAGLAPGPRTETRTRGDRRRLRCGEAEVAASGKGCTTINAARDLLLAHLKKEDDQLYGVLQAKARDDANLARTLNAFASDMQEISRFAHGFFAKLSDHHVPCEDMVRDFGTLVGLLGNRVRREEIVLYPAYDRAVAK